MSERQLCQADTKKGTSCKNKATIIHQESHYCHVHAPRLNIDCVICMSKLYDPCMIRCGHVFHNACLQKWAKYNHTCPICRLPMHVNVYQKEYRDILNMFEGPDYELALNVAAQSTTRNDFIRNLNEIGFSV